MKPDRTMAILESAMAEMQKEEFKFRKDCRWQVADGLWAARKILWKVYSDYVEQKSKKNPIWRLRVRLGFNKARKEIRGIEL